MPRRVAFLFNRNAPRLTRRLHDTARDAAGADNVEVSASVAEADEHCARWVGEEVDAVIVGGGDGTITAALTALATRARAASTDPPAIGVLRLGTGNAVADEVGAPRATRAEVRRLARVATEEPAAPPDSLATIEALGRVAPFCGFGVDASIIEDHRAVASWLERRGLGALARGPAGYALSLAARSAPRFLAGRRATVTSVNRGAPAIPVGRDGRDDAEPIAAGATLWTGPCTLAAAAAIRYFGFGLQMFAHAGDAPGRFQLRCGSPGLAEIVRSTPAAFRGAYYSGRVADFLCDAVTLELSEPMPFETGGELVGRQSRVDIAVGPLFSLVR